MSTTQDFFASLNIEPSKDLGASNQLDILPAYQVLHVASQTRLNARIEFYQDNKIKWIDFHEGQITRVYSNVIAEGYDSVMLRYDMIDRFGLEKVMENFPKVSSQIKWNHFFVERIKNLGFLNEQNQLKLLRLTRLDVIYNLLGWFRGTFKLSFDPKKLLISNDVEPLFVPDLFHELKVFIHEGKPLKSFAMKLNMMFVKKSKLDQCSFPMCISFLAKNKATGLLLLKSHQKEKKLQLDQGLIKSISSNLEHETLENTLLRNKKISPDDAGRARTISQLEKKSFRAVLLDQFGFDLPSINQAMNLLHIERALECFSWWSGNYQFEGDILSNENKEEITAQDNLPSVSLKESKHTQAKPFIDLIKQNQQPIYLLGLNESDLVLMLEKLIDQGLLQGQTLIVKASENADRDHLRITLVSKQLDQLIVPLSNEIFKLDQHRVDYSSYSQVFFLTDPAKVHSNKNACHVWVIKSNQYDHKELTHNLMTLQSKVRLGGFIFLEQDHTPSLSVQSV